MKNKIKVKVLGTGAGFNTALNGRLAKQIAVERPKEEDIEKVVVQWVKRIPFERAGHMANQSHIKGYDFYNMTKWKKRVPDLHLVKEHIYLKDGNMVKYLNKIHDYKRPFWIDPTYRKAELFKDKLHQKEMRIKNGGNARGKRLQQKDTGVNFYTQRKEYIAESRVQEFKVRQQDLTDAIITKLRNFQATKLPPYTKANIVRSSPYVYGSEMRSETLLKMELHKKHGRFDTGLDVAAFDIEASPETDEVWMVSIAKYGRVDVVVNRGMFAKGGNDYVFQDVLDKVREIILRKFKHVENIDRYKINLYIGDEKACLKLPFEMLHEWSPDILLAWNARYDMTVLTKRMVHHGINPKDVWCDPTLPEEDRYFEVQLGADTIETAGGVFKNKSPEEKWDKFHISASFQVLDGMQIYKTIRSASEGKMPGGYGIDNITKAQLGFGKVTSDDPEASKYVKAGWHNYMVENNPIEYTAYGPGDTIIMIELYRKIPDAEYTIAIFSGDSPLDSFNSGPKKLQDKYYEYLRGHGLIMGNPRTRDELDEEEQLLGRRGWTITLGAHYRDNPGAGLLNYDNIDHRLETDVTDLDMVSAYPSVARAVGLGLATTRAEYRYATGVSLEEGRVLNMGLIYGRANHIEYAEKFFKLPYIKDVVDAFGRDVLEKDVKVIEEEDYGRMDRVTSLLDSDIMKELREIVRGETKEKEVA